MTKIILCLASIMLFGAGAVWTNDTMADEYDQGKSLYQGKCQICHGVNGDGNGPAAASLTPKPADFANPAFWQKNNDEKMSDTIEHGHGMMPPFDLSPDQIKAVVDYISHAFKKDTKL
jgi:mono/diheme cytochrome c family protein